MFNQYPYANSYQHQSTKKLGALTEDGTEGSPQQESGGGDGKTDHSDNDTRFGDAHLDESEAEPHGEGVDAGGD